MPASIASLKNKIELLMFKKVHPIRKIRHLIGCKQATGKKTFYDGVVCASDDGLPNKTFCFPHATFFVRFLDSFGHNDRSVPVESVFLLDLSENSRIVKSTIILNFSKRFSNNLVSSALHSFSCLLQRIITS